MNLKQHPLSVPSDEAFGSCNWIGVCAAEELEICTLRSIKHPGYINYRMSNAKTGFQVHSKRPVAPHAVREWLSSLVGREADVPIEAFQWERVSAPDGDWDLDGGPRVRNWSIYFVVAGPFVKIGATGGDGSWRLRGLQTACPYEMRLVASLPGDQKAERELHKRFAEYRARPAGEWFRYEGALREYVESLL